MAYPTYADLQAFALTAGIITSADNALDYRHTIAAAIDKWERDTNYLPFIATSQTRKYDVPQGQFLDLKGGLVSLTSLAINGDAYTEDVQFYLLPRNADVKGQPFTAIKFAFPLTNCNGLGVKTVSIVGTFGYSATMPDDVKQAILSLGAVMLAPSKSGSAGAVQAIKQDDVEISYSSISTTSAEYSAQQLQLMALYDETVQRYKRLVIC